MGENDYYGEGGFLAENGIFMISNSNPNKFRGSFFNSSHTSLKSALSNNMPSPNGKATPIFGPGKQSPRHTYRQPYSFITQSYSDLRYITRPVQCSTLGYEY